MTNLFKEFTAMDGSPVWISFDFIAKIEPDVDNTCCLHLKDGTSQMFKGVARDMVARINKEMK